MTAVELPGGFTLGKSYEYGLDINLGTHGAPSWQAARRISAFQPTPTPTTQDSQTYDDLGAENSDVTGWSWTIAFTIQVNRSVTTGLYLPEVEALLARTKPTSKGEAATIEVRWYHKPESGTPHPTDAGQGVATVAYTRQNTAATGEIEVWSVTLSGKGPYEEIENPFTGWDETEPIVASITPPAAGDADLVTITGSGFLGATAVSIGGAVPEYTVVNAATIIAIMPTGDAGSVSATVTTPGGTSDTFAYTRGA